MDGVSSIPSASRLRRGATACLAVAAFAACWVIAFAWPGQLDYPLVRALNVFAGKVPRLDEALAWLTTDYLFSGVLLMALVWHCWFAADGAEPRSAVLVGTVGAFAAGLAGRALQLALPTHLRPMHDAALAMRLPAGVDPAGLNHWSSFPSDHAAVQFGLAWVVWQARPGLGRAALIWAVLLNTARIYLGAHFPTDVIGGAALGLLAVLLAQAAAAAAAARPLARLERSAPGAFYAVAFFLSYQIATLFDEARTMAAAALAVLRGLLTHGAA